jgi:hypothetical protein
MLAAATGEKVCACHGGGIAACSGDFAAAEAGAARFDFTA